MKRSTALLLALGIAALLAWHSRAFLFGAPYDEYWDSAANSLSILRAKQGAQLYGPYSRYDFHHPGPALLYVQALGEWLFFDLARLVPSPFQGQLLMHLLLMAGFCAAALRAFARWLPAARREAFLCAALTLGILHLSLMRGLPSFYDLLGGPTAFLSVWPVHALPVLFLCLLAAGASVAAGRGGDLPLLVLAGGFLTVHVAQGLFAGATMAAAYAGLLAHSAQVRAGRGAWWLAAWRAHRRAHLLAGALAALFALPMLLDLAGGGESNFAAIRQHLRAGAGDRKGALRSLAYFLQFGAYAPYQPGRADFGHYDRPGFLAYLRAHLPFYAGWLAVAALVLQAPLAYLRAPARHPATADPTPADEARRFLAGAALLTLLAAGLTLYWGTRQDGIMYYFNAWFNFAIYYFAALVAVGAACINVPAAWMAGRPRLARLAGVTAVILTAVLCADRLRIRDDFTQGDSPRARRARAQVGDSARYFVSSADRRALHASVARAIAASGAGHPRACRVLLFPPDDWPMAVGLALQAARAGERFATAGRWQIAFGPDHVWRSLDAAAIRAGLCPWYVVPAGAVRAGVAPGAPSYPLLGGAQLSLTPPALALAADRPATLDFAPGGNAAGFLLAGWGGPDPGGAWTSERWAALAFCPPPVAGSGVEVCVDGWPYLSPAHGLTRQRVRLFFNGEPVGAGQELSAPGTVRFLVPAAAWNAEAARAEPVASLAFELPDAASPAALDPAAPNGDPRRLGLFFQRVRLRAAP